MGRFRTTIAFRFRAVARSILRCVFPTRRSGIAAVLHPRGHVSTKLFVTFAHELFEHLATSVAAVVGGTGLVAGSGVLVLRLRATRRLRSTVIATCMAAMFATAARPGPVMSRPAVVRRSVMAASHVVRGTMVPSTTVVGKAVTTGTAMHWSGMAAMGRRLRSGVTARTELMRSARTTVMRRAHSRGTAVRHSRVRSSTMVHADVW